MAQCPGQPALLTEPCGLRLPAAASAVCWWWTLPLEQDLGTRGPTLSPFPSIGVPGCHCQPLCGRRQPPEQPGKHLVHRPGAESRGPWQGQNAARSPGAGEPEAARLQPESALPAGEGAARTDLAVGTRGCGECPGPPTLCSGSVSTHGPLLARAVQGCTQPEVAGGCVPDTHLCWVTEPLVALCLLLARVGAPGAQCWQHTQGAPLATPFTFGISACLPVHWSHPCPCSLSSPETRSTELLHGLHWGPCAQGEGCDSCRGPVPGGRGQRRGQAELGACEGGLAQGTQSSAFLLDTG